jgi:hypothetical protein
VASTRHRTGPTTIGRYAPPRGDVLTRSSLDELDLAREHRDALLRAAVEVTYACGHDLDIADCAEADCALDGAHAAGRSVCAVAHRLAYLADAPVLELPTPPLRVALADFLHALDAAADAIRACRQTAHAGAGCWFSPAPGIDGCGEILRLLHRCG